MRVASLSALGILLVIGALLWRITAMPGERFSGPLPAFTQSELQLAAQLRRHVVAIASEEHNVARYEALERAARYIELELRSYGYDVRPQKFASKAWGVRNLEVVVRAPAAQGAIEQALIVGAHYDSAPGTPGANDNGSGVAALLEFARMLRERPLNTLPSQRAMRLVFFVNEEPPYFKSTQMGSFVYAIEALERSENGVAQRVEKILGMISLETMGYYSDAPGSQNYLFPFNVVYPNRGDFIAFVGTLAARDFVRANVATFRKHAPFPSEGVAAPQFVTGVDWSDHWAFLQAGVPALMITDTAPFRYPHYHTAQDTVDKIDFRRLARVTLGLDASIRELAQQ
jgi:hypothetical protein